MIGFRYSAGARACGTAVAAPILVSTNYDTFDSAGGNSITLTGTTLSSATAVSVGGTSATITGNTATTVTFTTPSVTAGSKSVTVTTAGGTSNGLSIEAFSMAGLSLAGWYRAPVAGTWSSTASPWTSTASAGGSGTATQFAEVTNPPGVLAVNGFQAADFDGTNDILNAGVLSQHVTTGAGSILVLAMVDTVSTNSAQARLNHGIFAQNNVAFLHMSASTGGLRASIFDSAHDEMTVNTAFATGTWQLYALRWDGTNTYLNVDATKTSVTTSTGPSTLTTAIRTGANYNNPSLIFLDGKILEIITAKSTFTDANLAKINTCLRCRYAI